MEGVREQGPPHLALELHRANLEVHANGADVALRVGVVSEPQQEAGLAHAGVSDQQELEEVVVLWIHAHLEGSSFGCLQVLWMAEKRCSECFRETRVPNGVRELFSSCRALNDGYAHLLSRESRTKYTD